MRLARSSDLILALFVVAIVALLLVSVPSPLLDVLLVVNIAISLLLLLVALYVPNALGLFAFPSLLLLTTLFRLSLNVASTRLVLLDGYAGEVIQSFGMFLVRGEVVVGIMIFSIITVVNFVVITRGSGRVAEVAARFALDAMPGRQMSIDADMRAGLISAEEATRRREELKRESQLYGAMDGAMKFVQGDVIAGIFIIFINIIGGIYLGVSRGLNFSEAVQTYTILTVGDGLVTQIPALLISICAGIIVTRVSSGDQSTLGRDVGAQLFGRPGALIFAGILLIVIGLFPNLPWMAFWLVGLVFISAGILSRRKPNLFSVTVSTVSPLSLGNTTSTALLDGPQASRQSESSSLVIYLDAAVLHKLYALNREAYDGWWREFQRDFHTQHGLELPAVNILAQAQAEPVSYSIQLEGVAISSGKVLLDSVVVETNPEHAPFLGLEALLYEKHPITGQSVFWAARSPTLRSIAEAADVRTYDFLEFLFLKIGAFYLGHPEELLTLTAVYKLLDEVGRQHPNLIREVIDAKLIDPARLTELLQQLVREGIGIRSLKQILEAVAAFHAERAASLEAGETLLFSIEELTMHVRTARKRHLVAGLLSERNTLKVVSLSDSVDQSLEEIASDSSHSLDRLGMESLRKSLSLVLDPVRQRGILPISILCRAELKSAVQRVVSLVYPGLRVLTVKELDADVTVERVGVW